MFITYGVLGLAWLVLWLPLIPDRPPAAIAAAAAVRPSVTPLQKQQRPGLSGRESGAIGDGSTGRRSAETMSPAVGESVGGQPSSSASLSIGARNGGVREPATAQPLSAEVVVVAKRPAVTAATATATTVGERGVVAGEEGMLTSTPPIKAAEKERGSKEVGAGFEGWRGESLLFSVCPEDKSVYFILMHIG